MLSCLHPLEWLQELEPLDALQAHLGCTVQVPRVAWMLLYLLTGSNSTTHAAVFQVAIVLLVCHLCKFIGQDMGELDGLLLSQLHKPESATNSFA